MSCSQMGRQNTASLKKWYYQSDRIGLNVINLWKGVKWGGGGKKFFWGTVRSIWWREEEGKISRWNCLWCTRHVTYLNLIGQTNASIEFVPGSSQPQRNITCVPRLDINYIMSRHNVLLFSIYLQPSVNTNSKNLAFLPLQSDDVTVKTINVHWNILFLSFTAVYY